MAIQEIRYGGMTAQPSDYENKDGELAVSVNLLNEEGHLSPLLPAEVVKQLPEGTKGCWVHRTSEYMHYILWGDYEVFPEAPVVENALLWIDSEDMETIHDMEHSYAGITKVVPLGNTLCILHEGGMVYLLWKEDEYKELSPNLPEVKLSFGLQCEFEKNSLGYVLNVKDSVNTQHNTQTNAILGCVNKLLKDCSDKGKFTMPFFVRYAYRLFDESCVNVSAPILMVPNSSQPIVMRAGFSYEAQNQNVYNVWVYTPACDLDMQVLSIGDLSDYSDIIRSVDIFVSRPIYTYDQAGTLADTNEDLFEDFFDDYRDSAWGVFQLKGSNGTFINGHSRYSIFDAYLMNTGDTKPKPYRIVLPKISEDTQIGTTSSFHLLNTITLTELSNNAYSTREVIPIDYKTLTNIDVRPKLIDDNATNNLVKSNVVHSYNQRMIFGNIVTELPGHFEQSSFADLYRTTTITHHFVQVEGEHDMGDSDEKTWDEFFENHEGDYESIDSITTATSDILFKIQDIRVKIKKKGTIYTVKEDNMLPFCSFDKYDGKLPAPNAPGGRFVFWFYYPDPDAYQVIMSGYFENEQTYYILKFALKPHDMLNGAYYFSNFEWTPVHQYSTLDVTEEAYLSVLNTTYPVSTDKTIAQPNKLYTSEVLNPWYFPVEGIVTVGNGELTALSAATQALSQGQFGEFPLYAFCSDGVWALTVGQTGYFTRSVPVSRDVCTNPDSVLQIDDAVIYPTDRGLMLLAGSKNVCFTEPMNNREGKDYESQLPGMRELRAMAGLSAPSTYATVAERQHRCLNPAPLREFLQDCKMLYDYVGQKIVVYNPKIETYSNGQISFMYRKYKYALVYSLKTNLWGMTETDLQWTVNSYPEAMGMTDEKKLVTFSRATQEESGQQSAVTGLFITRPLKLGAPDVLKTVRTVMQRGMFRRGDVKSVLWGSRDLYNWYLIHSSQDEGLHNMSGTPYKYFIIGGLVTLTEGKSVSGASLEVEAKMTDVLR